MFSTPTYADAIIPSEISEEKSEENDPVETPPKQVGAVSAEAAKAARTSTAGKYVLAAGAVALGVAALILVARHHGQR